MELHERIAFVRKAAGLTQEQLGEKLGVTRQAVSKWESNQATPDALTIARLCTELGISADFVLLGKEPDFNIRGDERTKIYARNDAHPSSYIDQHAKTVNCFIAEGCEVYGTVKHSVVSVGCYIGKGTIVEDSVVMPGVVIEEGAIVRHAILGESSKVETNAVVGGVDKKDISVTSKGAVVEANTVLAPGAMI